MFPQIVNLKEQEFIFLKLALGLGSNAYDIVYKLS